MKRGYCPYGGLSSKGEPSAVSVACSPRLAGRRLVFAQFYHLAQNKPHAGKHAGQADPLL